MFSIIFPQFDPVLMPIYGPLAIRWYGLAYVVGIVGGWWWALQQSKRYFPNLTSQVLGDFIVWALLGAVIGGRLGYMIAYQPLLKLLDPLEILRVWTGGMAFHGGMLGVCVATWFFVRRHTISLWPFSDLIAISAPIGLFFGRIANFINGELYGTITQAPWGVIFPLSDGQPRHPSQIYEAFYEGITLFILLNLFYTRNFHRPGFVSGLFMVLYAFGRTLIECLREPDLHLGYIFMHVSMGQILSLPMFIVGLIIMISTTQKTRPHDPAKVTKPS